MNNISQIDGHILLPHQADWNVLPKLKTIWRNEIATAQDGDEDRASVRGTPWKILSYNILCYNQVERARYEARMIAAKKSGKIVIPWMGKGCGITEQKFSGDDSVTVDRATHGFTANQLLFIQSDIPSDFDIWEIVQVQSVASSSTLVLTQDLVNNYPASASVWPLLFGRPLPEPWQALNSRRFRHQITVQYDARQVNYVADEDFSSYPVGSITTLSGGSGWNGPWVIGAMA